MMRANLGTLPPPSPLPRTDRLARNIVLGIWSALAMAAFAIGLTAFGPWPHSREAGGVAYGVLMLLGFPSAFLAPSIARFAGEHHLIPIEFAENVATYTFVCAMFYGLGLAQWFGFWELVTWIRRRRAPTDVPASAASPDAHAMRGRAERTMHRLGYRLFVAWTAVAVAAFVLGLLAFRSPRPLTDSATLWMYVPMLALGFPTSLVIGAKSMTYLTLNFTWPSGTGWAFVNYLGSWAFLYALGLAQWFAVWKAIRYFLRRRPGIDAPSSG